MMTDPFAPAIVEPAVMMVGGFHSWTIPDTFDPLKYSVTYKFSKGNSSYELSGTYLEEKWTFTANSAFSSQFTVGRWHMDLVITRILDDEPMTLRASTVQMFETSADRMSHARIMVDKIESILSGRADSDVDSYTIKSRSISKMSVRELTDWRDYYLAECGREPDPITGRVARHNTVKVRFV